MFKTFKFRIRRTNFFFACVVVGLVRTAMSWWMFRQLNVEAMTVLQLDIESRLNGLALPVTIVGGLCDVVMLGLMAARMQDANVAGWWVLVLVPAACFFPLIALIAILVLIFYPGTIGPNHFGPDPRGWLSREHYDEQRARLKSGNI